MTNGRNDPFHCERCGGDYAKADVERDDMGWFICPRCGDPTRFAGFGEFMGGLEAYGAIGGTGAVLIVLALVLGWGPGGVFVGVLMVILWVIAAVHDSSD